MLSLSFIFVYAGGARSLSVFDNDIGSGSVSPFIVTGGKGGDVGLHDFRYIATGRTKRHKHFASGKVDSNSSLTADMQNGTGDQNRDGMLWYIPKAHLGNEALRNGTILESVSLMDLVRGEPTKDNYGYFLWNYC